MTDIRPTAALPLQGVRILAFEQFGAGPWGTLQLADLGAEVIKVEDPHTGGDVSRYVPPFQQGEEGIFFETFNRGKRSVSLDLRSDAGREALARLVPAVDAVFCNLRGDQPERLGLTYAQLSRLNRRIVCCSLSGFGMTGPRAAQGAYDYVLQAMAGWMSLTGGPDAPPTKSGLSLVDLCGGYVASIALLAGITRARSTGEGCQCDLSLYETALSLLCYVGAWAATEGYVPDRMDNSAHPSIVPFQAFETADGWITVACAKEKFWLALCEAAELRELLADPRFADFAGRREHRAELLEILEPAFRARTSDAWVALLERAGVPVGRVNDVVSALRDPQAQARGVVQEHEHPALGAVRLVASPLRVGDAPAPPRRGPRRGEDTADAMRELARLDDDEVARLADAGAFGAQPLPSVGG